MEVRVTVFPEKAVTQYGGVPWWIILVAVLAGILMLALLVFLLWKVGMVYNRNTFTNIFTVLYSELLVDTCNIESLFIQVVL